MRSIIQEMCIIGLVSLLLFPQATGFAAFSMYTVEERTASVDISENDENGVVALDKAESVVIDEEEEELVEATNNFDFDVETAVELDESIEWEIVGDSSVTLSSGQGELYRVDTTDVDEAVDVGEYAVVTQEGSFVFTTERTVQFEEPIFDSTDGDDVVEEVQENGFNDGECDREENRCVRRVLTLDNEDIEGFAFVESRGQSSLEISLFESSIGGAVVGNAGSSVDTFEVDSSTIGGDVYLKTHDDRPNQDGDVDADLSNGALIEGDVVIDAENGDVDIATDDSSTIQGDLIIRGQELSLDDSIDDVVEGEIITTSEQTLPNLSEP